MISSYSNAIALRFARLHHVCINDLKGIIVFARLRELFIADAYTLIAPVTGLAHSRIVSISRGSPPPKKR